MCSFRVLLAHLLHSIFAASYQVRCGSSRADIGTACQSGRDAGLAGSIGNRLRVLLHRGETKMAAARKRGRKSAAKKSSGGRRTKAQRSASARKGARTRARKKAARSTAARKGARKRR